MERPKFKCYFAWANNAVAKSSALTLEEIRKLVKVGIDQLERGKYVTGMQLRENLGLRKKTVCRPPTIHTNMTQIVKGTTRYVRHCQ
jgi:hypothetical protein